MDRIGLAEDSGRQGVLMNEPSGSIRYEGFPY